MTVLYLYLVVWGVTNWAFSVWGSNCKNSVDLCHFLCFSARLPPPLNLKAIKSHHGFYRKLIRQYRSILVPNSPAQAEMAIASAPPASKTVVLEGSTFTVAEQRHQKNRLRRDPAMVRCLVQSGQDDFTSSHLATRLNG